MQAYKFLPREGTKAAETGNESSSYPWELVLELDPPALCKPPHASVGAGPAGALQTLMSHLQTLASWRRSWTC
ncbi:hypothetical protein TIFTF001_020568 [Ficus carica]|uniref:Uncharacterized protein n=1 Tax=Ficus carica TaxID=3494 RepID=A0AA88AGA5_FICCA|nr:hypothetical protein TIFTF001_020568 [Ficus carica]